MTLEQVETYTRLTQIMAHHTKTPLNWQDPLQKKHFIDHKQTQSLYGTDFSTFYQNIGTIYGSEEACQFIIDNHKDDLDILRGAG